MRVFTGRSPIKFSRPKLLQEPQIHPGVVVVPLRSTDCVSSVNRQTGVGIRASQPLHQFPGHRRAVGPKLKLGIAQGGCHPGSARQVEIHNRCAQADYPDSAGWLFRELVEPLQKQAGAFVSAIPNSGLPDGRAAALVQWLFQG